MCTMCPNSICVFLYEACKHELFFFICCFFPSLSLFLFFGFFSPPSLRFCEVDLAQSFLTTARAHALGLSSQSGGVDAVAKEAAALLASGHYDAAKIEARKDAIEERWAELLKAAETRKTKLGEALEYQQCV
jgi:hypothetical protein